MFGAGDIVARFEERFHCQGDQREQSKKRGDGEGAATCAQQKCADGGADLLRIGAEGVCDTGSQQLLGSENGVDQRLKALFRFGGVLSTELAWRGCRTERKKSAA